MFLPKEVKVSKENFQIMQPILLLSRICGLCPIYYKNCGHFYKLQWSALYGIYSYVLSSVLVVITFMTLVETDQSKKNTSKSDKKATYVTAIDEISATTVLIFCVLAIPFKLKSLWKICHCFTEIETIFSIKNVVGYRKKSIYFICSVLVVYSTIYICDIIVWHIKLKRIESSKAFLMEYVPYYILKYMLLSQILFFCHLVYFIKIRISCLNTLLLTDIKAHVRMNINTQKFTKVLRVFELANSQKKIFETVSIMTNTAAFGIVPMMLSFLLHLTSSTFFLLTEIEKQGNIYFVYLQSVWLFAHVGKLFMIIESCQQCAKESEKTTQIVHNLLTDDTLDTVKNELTIFAIQLSKCKIKFDICGLFNIDRSIFTSFVAAITTYLVVLLQLNN